ncbi:MAG: sensor histidine kinase [Actinomycetes bacterium]
MTGPTTLRGRLSLVAVVTTGVWVLGLTAVFNVVLIHQLDAQADDVLRTRSSAAASTILVRRDARLILREQRNDAALDTGIWIYQGTTALERPKAPPVVQRAADHMAGHGRQFREVEDGGVRLYGSPLRAGGRQIGTVVSATSLEPYHRTAELALLASLVLSVLLLSGVYFVTRRVVARALQPVTEMAQQAARWSAHDTSQRFGEQPPRPGELRDLAANLDSVLDHISAVLRHEHEVAAELSHELKTTLSLMLAENELLATGPRSDEERERGHEVIASTGERMNRLLDTLLVEAAQIVTEAPGRCAVAPVVQRAADEAGDHGALSVTAAVPEGLEVGVSAEVARRILLPLLGNAYRYARSCVSVTARRESGHVDLLVLDDGPGVPEEFRADVFEPGRRADPDDDHPGAGLGLALARRLARGAGGDIALADSSSGAAFRVTLPTA